MPNLKQVVILAGGKGTRLKSVSFDHPKSMVYVNGKPILHHLIEQCRLYGFSDICLLVSYGSNEIIQYFRDGSDIGVTIDYFNDDSPKGTAGALLSVLDELNDNFLVLYGDTYFDINLQKMWDFHELHGSDATLFLHPNDHPYDSDLVELDSNEMNVIALYAYPHDNHYRRNLVNAAAYIISKSSLIGINAIPGKMDIAKELFPIMLKNGKKLSGYISTEYIKDMGTPDRLDNVKRDISSGKVSMLKHSFAKKAVFLDRDGVINQEVGHISSLEQFKLIPGASSAIRQLNLEGYLTIIITNQPVIARGMLTVSGLRIIHNKMDTLLGKDNAYIDKLYYCPHHPDRGFEGEISALKIKCNCRKPGTELIYRAAKEMNISLKESWFIGDRTADILAGTRSGLKTILVKTGHAGKDKKYFVKPDYFASNLTSAVDNILKD